MASFGCSCLALQVGLGLVGKCSRKLPGAGMLRYDIYIYIFITL